MIALIENAILARLKAASDQGVLGYKYAALDSLPVDIDEELQKLIKGYPSAWTVFGGWRPVHAATNGAVVRGTWHVVVAAQNLRNERSTRVGGSDSEVGSYQMIEDVAGLLMDRDLGLPIGGLQVGACTPLYARQADKDRRISLFGLELFSDFILEPVAAPPAADDDFATFHVNWDVRPFGGIDADPATAGVQLPDDAHADATSHITLETQE